MVQAHLDTKEVYMRRMTELFHDIDQDSDGTITLGEFQEKLRTNEVKAYLASLDIEPEDAWTLFKLLDHQDNGYIEMHHFVEGCIRLQGHARRIDLAIMMYENKWMIRRMSDFTKYVKTHFENDTRFRNSRKMSMMSIGHASSESLS
eukprot:gnl/TRDRNA2_/TRDRNA2_171335_c2_seq1.p2 gnl/TRDRNA2_/TRDRNA2_171335_c2~~gnl/TRDRNA2_/TRDRNA2_171335_c2_seq1.p2  ORF type:complete len:147 (-),score=29.03 gnl/TRDRNA2_/TRDRNA2_171335_c2_seq1:82-522(-)